MISILFISLALSLDAFSLSLSLGTTKNFKNKNTYLFFISIMHAIFPLCGLLLSKLIINNYIVNVNIFLIFLYLIIGTLMLFDTNDEMQQNCKIITLFLLAFSVSFDSFYIGIGLKYITESIIFVIILFGLISGIVSYLGIKLGKTFKKRFEKQANIAGAIILYILAVVNLVKYFQ